MYMNNAIKNAQNTNIGVGIVKFRSIIIVGAFYKFYARKIKL